MKAGVHPFFTVLQLFIWVLSTNVVQTYCQATCTQPFTITTANKERSLLKERFHFITLAINVAGAQQPVYWLFITERVLEARSWR